MRPYRSAVKGCFILLFILFYPLMAIAETLPSGGGRLILPGIVLYREAEKDIPLPENFNDPSCLWLPGKTKFRRIYPPEVVILPLIPSVDSAVLRNINLSIIGDACNEYSDRGKFVCTFANSCGFCNCSGFNYRKVNLLL